MQDLRRAPVTLTMPAYKERKAVFEGAADSPGSSSSFTFESTLIAFQNISIPSIDAAHAEAAASNPTVPELEPHLATITNGNLPTLPSNPILPDTSGAPNFENPMSSPEELEPNLIRDSSEGEDDASSQAHQDQDSPSVKAANVRATKSNPKHGHVSGAMRGADKHGKLISRFLDAEMNALNRSCS